MSNNKLKVAIYCRVAHADQSALEQQEKCLLDYTGEHGYSDPLVYLDNGFSGLDFNRPSFSRLNDDINSGKIDTVIVRNVSRIGRNFISVGNWIDGLEKRGISIITTDHPREMLSNDFKQMITAVLRSQKGACSPRKRKSKI